jgi:hypothetical protein
MTERRRFKPPWSIEESSACFIVRDCDKQALAYIYYENESGRHSRAKLLTRDEAYRATTVNRSQHFSCYGFILDSHAFLGLGVMEGKPYMRLASVIAGLLIAGAFLTTLTLADDESGGAPVILSPMDGAVVRSPVTVIVGQASDAMYDEDTKPATNDAPKQMGPMNQKEQLGQMGEMHGDEQHHGAHLHLIVDSPLPKTGVTVPMDEKHIHLMHGETKVVLNLAPGKHTLQLIVGGEDHVIGAQAPHSKLITITVQ